MTHPTELDLGPLTWVKSEIDNALGRAATGLEEAAAAEDPAGRVQFAQTHLHQARGALSIVGLDGLTQFIDALDHMLGAAAKGEIAIDGSLLALGHRALAAIGNYIDELVHGSADQPLRLGDLYVEILSARGVTSGSRADLFFPDLSLRPPRRGAPPAASAAEAAARLREMRTLFERGLLAWLKNPGNPAAANAMRDAAIGIEQTQTNATSRALWWASVGFFEGLAAGSIEQTPTVRRLCTQLDAQIRRMSGGSASVPDRLMREVLYQVACAPVTTDQQRAIVATWRLDSLVPEAGAAISHEPLAPQLQALRNRLNQAKDVWDQFCGGSAAALPRFESQLGELALQAKQLGRPAFLRLLAGLTSFSQWLRKDPLQINEALSLEIATALLLGEAALERGGPDASFSNQVADTLKRIAALIRGEAVESTELSAAALGARRNQEREAIAQLSREILSSLAHVEQTLDDFFRNNDKRAPLATLSAPLRQIEGALSLLGDQGALELVREASASIAQLAEADTAPEPDSTEQLAHRLSALGFYIEALQRGPASLESFLNPGATEPTIEAPAVEPAPAPEPPPAAAAVHVEPATEQAVAPPDLAATALAFEFNLSDVPEPAPAEPEALAEPVLDIPPLETLELTDLIEDEFTVEPPPPPEEAPAPAPETARLLEASEAEIDAELLEIFIEEAHDVLGSIGEHGELLRNEPDNREYLTAIRRGFHTLKGSGRMVGLRDLGEAAWGLEQVFNRWLQFEWAPTPALFALIDDARRGFSAWVAQLEAGGSHAYDLGALQQEAERLRSSDEPIVEPGGGAAATQPSAPLTEAVAAVAEPIHEDLPEAETDEAVINLDLSDQAFEFDLGEEPVFEPAQPVLTPPAQIDSAVSLDLEDAGQDESIALEEISLEALDAGGAALEEFSLEDDEDLNAAPALASSETLADVEISFADELDSEALEVLEAIDIERDEPTPFTEAPLELDSSSTEAVAFELPAAGESAETIDAAETDGDEIVLEGLDDDTFADTDETLILDDESFDLDAAFEADTLPQQPGTPPPAAALDFDFDLELPESPALSVAQAPEPDTLVEVAQPGAETIIVNDLPPQAAPAGATAAPVVEPDSDTVRIGDAEISRPLYDLYLAEARHHIGTLHQELGRLLANPTLLPAEVLVRAAHTLAGISGTARLMSLHALARAMEHGLARCRDNQIPPTSEQVALLQSTADTLEAMVAEVAERSMPLAVPELADLLDGVGRPPQLEETPLAEEPLLAEDDLLELGEPQPVVTAPADEMLAAPAVEPPAPAEAAAPATPAAPPSAAAAPAATADVLPAVTDEIDTQLLPIFLEESAELFSELNGALRGWRGDLVSDKFPQSIARLLHTLKGSARMTGAMTLGEHVHLLESQFISGRDAGKSAAAQIEELQSGLDLAELAVDALARGETPQPIAAPTPVADQPSEGAAGTQAASAPAPTPSPAAETPAPAPTEADTSATSATIRVRADAVDRFVNQAGEIGIARTRIEGELRTLRRSLLDLTENVIRLRNQLREVEIQADIQMQSRMAQAESHHAEFDPLEMDRYTRLQELTRMMAESVNDVTTIQQNLLKNLDGADVALHGQARMSRELQQALMQVRMVPFDSLADRLYRVVRQSAKDLGKRANLDLRGGRIELDRGVLEHMVAPLEHLLRNSVAHGIEDAESRRGKGKSEIGEITLSVTQEGNELVIDLADDGSGLNFERIAEKARAAGLLGANEQPDERRLTNLIFVPGFSTAGTVSQVSGRGVGMDVVKAETASVGGRIEVSSQTGSGTRFRIYLPLTLAVTQALLVRAGNRSFAIPSTMVAQVMEVKTAPLEAIQEQGGVDWQGVRYNYRYLPRLLGDAHTQPEVQRFNWILLLRAGAQTLALHVDALRGNQEIVVKTAGPQVARLVGVTGATVLGDGEVVLILNPVALASREQGVSLAGGSGSAAPQAPARIPVVMVVDDSLTVRKISSRLLEREGYQVVTAKDGVDALEKLLEMVPDVILSDIEMPRMDGFDLLRNIRADERTRNVPVIMITSRLADKHRSYAQELGANHYLGKPYQEEELLGLLADYTGRH